MSPPWSLLELIQKASEFLASKGVPTARLDAEVLMAHILRCRRIDLYLRHDQPVQREELDAFRKLVRRRGQREPVAYIIGQREFWSLAFSVNPSVLIPRPETELLVEASLEFIQEVRRQLHGLIRVLDIGTGCGAIALSIAAHSDDHVSIVATDISADALEVAEQNAHELGLEGRVRFLQGPLFVPLDAKLGPFHLIVSNPPYIKSDDFETLPPEVRDFEPRVALDGGPDGLSVIRALLEEGPFWLEPEGAMFLETASTQKGPIEGLLRGSDRWGSWHWRRDLAGLNRVLCLKRTPLRKGCPLVREAQEHRHG